MLSAQSILPQSIPSPGWSGFEIGNFTIHAYALCILLGIVLAMLLTARRFKERGGNTDAVYDICIWAIPFGIVGGRLYHVISSPDAYFGPNGNLSLIPQLWLGGLGIWGAVALGTVGAWIGCRRAGVRLSAFLDAAAPGVLLAQAVGRWGNWFNQELFGAPTDLPWGLEIDANNANFPAGVEPGTLFHPTFLYESLWNLAGVAILLLLDKKFRLHGGRMFWLYVAYYTLGRVWIETLRIDDAEMISLFGVTARLNVWVSLLVFVLALVAFLYLSAKRNGLSAKRNGLSTGKEQPAVPKDGSVELTGGQDAESVYLPKVESSSARAYLSTTNSAGASTPQAPKGGQPEPRD